MDDHSCRLTACHSAADAASILTTVLRDMGAPVDESGPSLEPGLDEYTRSVELRLQAVLRFLRTLQ